MQHEREDSEKKEEVAIQSKPEEPSQPDKN